MNLNLKIRPLSSLESLVNQKCLIPKSKFPNALMPGAWCRCYRGTDGSYNVCQVFPRSNIPVHCCYMDDTVNYTVGKTQSSEEVLTRLEALQIDNVQLDEEENEEKRPTEIMLTYVVAEQLFEKNLGKITLDYLKQRALQHLPALHLVAGCEVRLSDLDRVGITAIKLDAVKGISVQSNAFTINEGTTLKVNDVQLIGFQAAPTFYPYGFEHAQDNLRDLLLAADMLKNCQWQMRPSFNVLLTGATGCGKSSLVNWFTHEYHCNCFCITPANILGQYPGETEALLRQRFQAVKLFVSKLQPKSPTLLLIEDLHLLCPVVRLTAVDSVNSQRISSQLLSLVDDLHSTGMNVICLATSAFPESINDLARRPGRFGQEISIPKPTEQQRGAIFRSLFDDGFYAAEYKNELTDELLEMVSKQTQGFVFADLQLLARSVEQQLIRRDGTTCFGDILKRALKQAKPTSMYGTDLTVCRTEERFDDIGGMEQLKRTLEISIMMGLKEPAVYKRFGLNLPKGVLLYGPPGCAKTTIAKCIATEANMTFIAASGAEVYSPYIGCAEKFIAKIFDTARKHAPCLIFLDEIDSLVGCRCSDQRGEIQIRILSTLLTEMDGIASGGSICSTQANHILVVAATNRPDILDEALLRPGRFDKLIHVPAPDMEARHAILKLYAQRMPFASDVDLLAIAQRTTNYSGADICNLCNEAALHALSCDFNASLIGMKHFEHVLHEQKSSLTQTQIDWYLNFERKFVS